MKNRKIAEVLKAYRKMNNLSVRDVTELLEEKEISTSQISKDTGIWEKKLTDENVTFTASEFLELCSYLHLKPEDLR